MVLNNAAQEEVIYTKFNIKSTNFNLGILKIASNVNTPRE